MSTWLSLQPMLWQLALSTRFAGQADVGGDEADDAEDDAENMDFSPTPKHGLLVHLSGGAKIFAGISALGS